MTYGQEEWVCFYAHSVSLIKWASSLPKKHASLSLAFNQSVKQNFSLTYAVRQFVSICDLRE